MRLFCLRDLSRNGADRREFHDILHRHIPPQFLLQQNIQFQCIYGIQAQGRMLRRTHAEKGRALIYGKSEVLCGNIHSHLLFVYKLQQLCFEELNLIQ